MSKQVSDAEAKVAAKRAAFDRAARELEDATRELQLAGAAYSAAEREKAATTEAAAVLQAEAEEITRSEQKAKREAEVAARVARSTAALAAIDERAKAEGVAKRG